MRRVEVTQSFERNGFKFEAGHEYLMAEDIESQFRNIAGPYLGMSQSIDSIYRRYNGEDLNGKRLLTYRTGGIGDLAFLNPVVRYLKKKYPTCFIRVASGCKEPLMNLPEIDELYDMPFDINLFEDCDYHLQFQGIIEASSEKSKKTHAVDMFFSYFSIDSTHLPAEDKKPRMVFTKEESDWLGEECKKLGIDDSEMVIGIQLETSSPIRNYPKERLKVVIDALASEPNTKVVLIGSQQQAIQANFLSGGRPNVIAAVNYSVRQAIIMVNRYNIVISPDSFIVQIAGALDKPLVGIYGPFPSEVRMKYFKNAIGIEPDVKCSPCFKHDFRACIKGFPSPCFSLVKPEDILQAVDFLRHKFHGGHFNYMMPIMRVPDFPEDIEKYFLSADKGLCFFGGYFKHDNMIHVETNEFTQPDISDLNYAFDRGKYPFVVFINKFELQNGSVYQNAKDFVRPGGYFISYKMDCHENMFGELKRDTGRKFVVLYSKFNPANRSCCVVGRKPF